LIVSKDKNRAFIKMPSGKSVTLDLRGRATIGCVSCGGRGEKPFIKAGRKHHAMKAKKRQWPRVRGVAMNPVDHPFGGAQHHAGKSKSTSRHAHAGRKVGAIASKRTGRKKK
jgi:large subunit ribosomal protein L2